MTTAPPRVYPEGNRRGGGRSGAAARGLAASILTLILIGVPVYMGLLFMDIAPLPFYQPSEAQGIQVYEYSEPGNPDSELTLVRTLNSETGAFETEADLREWQHAYLSANYEDVPLCEVGQDYQQKRGWFSSSFTWVCK